MTSTKHAKSGTWSWADLSTPAVAEAKQFYVDLFDWKFNSSDSPMGTYHIASVSGRDVAGVMAHPPERAGAPAVWTVFFYVDDIAAALERATAAGGSIVQPMQGIGGDAVIAAAADTSGAIFGLISGGEAGPSFSMDEGAVSWVELMTRTPTDAISFYADVFGWSAATDDDAPVPYTLFSVGGDPASGLVATPDHVPAEVPDNWSIYITVKNCADCLSRAAGLGGTIVVPATPTPMGPFAVVADPQGAVFQLMEYSITQ